MASAVSQSQDLISVDEYLEGERSSEVRHEYVAGRIYAMAGASRDAVLKLSELKIQIPFTRIYEQTAVSRTRV